MLSGWKTYIFSGIVAISGALFALGYLTRDQFEALAGVFGGAAGMALRAGVSKVEGK
jgi:hypothetical protein